MFDRLLQYLSDADASLLLAVNGNHAAFWDMFMWLVGNPYVWIPFYASLVYVLVLNYSWRAVAVCAICILAVILLTDGFASQVIRPLVGRMRPSNLQNPLSEIVHVVDGHRGGRFGFPSAHSGNAWAIAFFVACLFRHRMLTFFLALWALLVCYSRLYMGVHYPGDLLGGMLLASGGVTLAYWAFLKFVREHPQHHMRQAYVPVVMGICTLVFIVVASLCS